MFRCTLRGEPRRPRISWRFTSRENGLAKKDLFFKIPQGRSLNAQRSPKGGPPKDSQRRSPKGGCAQMLKLVLLRKLCANYPWEIRPEEAVDSESRA